MNAPLTNRHDILILFEVTNGNPNGDPDSGNMPRVDPSSSLGLVSDVCLKRKIRNYIQLFPPSHNGKGFDIFITQGAVLETRQREAEQATGDKKRTNDINAKAARDWLCNRYYDIRTFGAVVSTGKKEKKGNAKQVEEKSNVLAGSAHGQVRGPVQFTFGRSLHPINPVEVTITRCAVTKEEDAAKERTMGQKYIVPYGLYAAKCYVSPAFAEQTGFDQGDYDLLIEALTHLFDHDRSASRGDMVVRGLFDFEHVGTQAASNAEQNRREARLGCAHAHKLFDSIEVKLKNPDGQPSSFGDYGVQVNFDEARFPGVTLHKHIDPESA